MKPEVKQLTRTVFGFSTVHYQGGWEEGTLQRPLSSSRVQCRLQCGQEQSQAGGHVDDTAVPTATVSGDIKYD